MVIIDIEVYRDYFLVAAQHHQTKKRKFWSCHGESGRLDAEQTKSLRNVLGSATSVTFNGNNYDMPLISYALSGASCGDLKRASDTIIKSKSPGWRVLKELKITVPPSWDHVDLIELPIGNASLKIYGGRLHAPRLQSLPIDPDASITPDQRKELVAYCVNDLETTGLLLDALMPQIELRKAMSEQYGQDFRSRSDAQIAEHLIISELSALTGQEYSKPSIPDGHAFHYRDPGFVSFETKALTMIYRQILAHPFSLGANGSVVMPAWLRETKIRIGEADYQMGIGGLHSCEKCQTIYRTPGMILADYDVASYYPSIIMQQRLAPDALGAPFLDLYQSLITRRLAAKRSGDKVTADTLKIVLNGSFGKFGSKYSKLYAPELLIQTTITGQLALLMLIEALEGRGVRVVSANTDGIVIYHPDHLAPVVEELMFDWELETTYELERTDYRVLASRDVNNYCAVKTDGTIKGKGVFAPPSLAKNPDGLIVYAAVARWFADKTPIADTITECRDIRQFVTLRRVDGGAVWRGEDLGKAVRFYKSSAIDEQICIRYARNQNKVPNSDGCRPLMDLPDAFPEDVDHGWYIAKAEQLRNEILNRGIHA